MAMPKGEAALEITDLIVGLMNLFKRPGSDLGRIGQFLKSGGAKIIAQQMPKLFGIGFSENSLTLDILQRAEKVNPGSAAKMEKLADGMTDYERYFFWMTVTSIQVQKVATKQSKPAEKAPVNGQPATPAEEIVYQPVSDAELDNRVQSLLFIVKLFEQHGEDATATIHAMYSVRIIEQSWLIRIWSYFSTAIKEKVLDPNGVTSIKELVNSQGLLDTLKKHNDKLEQVLATSRTETSDHPSIFVWLIERMLLGSHKTPVTQTWEWTLLKKIFSKKFCHMSFRWPISIEEKPQPMSHSERIPPTFDGDQK